MAQGGKTECWPDWCGREGPRGRASCLRAPSLRRRVGNRPQNTFAASVAAWNLRPVALRPRLNARTEVFHRLRLGRERHFDRALIRMSFTRVSARFAWPSAGPPRGGGTGPKWPGPERGTTGTL